MRTLIQNIQFGKVQYFKILALSFLILFVSQNVFASDPVGDCPCNCEQILKDNYGGAGVIYLVPIGNNCYQMNISITGCGDRTIYGFTLDFQINQNDPCLN